LAIRHQTQGRDHNGYGQMSFFIHAIP